ncbi:MAG: hypothetical protein KAG20_05460, partial [Cocleimonas sp.]|nr:hypothetical protein [Cocleimonas sp.]
SQIVYRLNGCFIGDELSDKDRLNYLHTVTDKLSENTMAIMQMQNNTAEQAMLGEFDNAVEDAILGSSEAHQHQMMQLLSDPKRMEIFKKIAFDVLQKES